MSGTRVFVGLLLALAVSAGLVAQSAQELYQRGLVEERANGDLPAAVALYRQAIQASGRDRGLAARARLRVAGAQEKLGQRVDAEGAYAEVIRAYPEQRAEVALAQERLAALRPNPRAGDAVEAVASDDVLASTGAVFDRFCTSCHGQANRTADLRLDAGGQGPVSENPALWERVARRLRARLDPPAGLPRPDDATYRAVTSRLEQVLDAAHAANRASLPADPVDAVELAARMATFLWNGAPDAELLASARRGSLRDPVALNRQVARMLRDPRSDSLVDRFFSEWLLLDRLGKTQPDSAVHPQFDPELRQAMETETRLFVQSQLREDRGALELWTADYTVVNERLARHYGLPGVTGREFRRMAWPDGARAGLLGQAGPLTAVSQSLRTSPTARGVFVLTRFLGIDPPNPPANVPALAERPASPQGTLRERMGAHKLNPSCANCHALFDPLGLALENFDATGAWRTSDGGSPIDASGAFNDGTRFTGPADFRAGLLRYRDAYYAGITRQLLAFALDRRGRGGRVYDYEMPAVRKILREAAAANYRWSSILSGIVASQPFQTKTPVP